MAEIDDGGAGRRLLEVFFGDPDARVPTRTGLLSVTSLASAVFLLLALLTARVGLASVCRLLRLVSRRFLPQRSRWTHSLHCRRRFPRTVFVAGTRKWAALLP